MKSSTANAAGVRKSRHEVVLLYPGESLHRQVAAWGQRHADCAVEPLFIRSLIGIRRFLETADVAVIDATDDEAQAIDAFTQATARLGAAGTAVYTERMHEGLEELVRMRGALLLFGPLDDDQWEGFFERAIAAQQRRLTWRVAA
jgi:hypothetical protein